VSSPQRLNPQKPPGHVTKLSPPPPPIKKKIAPARTSIALTGRVEVSVPTRLKEIRRVVKMGAAVLPIVEGGKTPAIAGGYKAASKDRAAIEAPFRANPRLNYGIATRHSGRASSRSTSTGPGTGNAGGASGETRPASKDHQGADPAVPSQSVLELA